MGRTWNKRWAGKEAMTAIDSGGHRMGRICGEYWQAHRAIWTMVYGEQPKMIDHIDGNPANNRLDNLREVTHLENCRNTRIRTDNKSGVMGVTFDARSGRWRASITFERRFISLGLHPTIEEAAAVRQRAERLYDFHPNHGRRRHISGS